MFICTLSLSLSIYICEHNLIGNDSHIEEIAPGNGYKFNDRGTEFVARAIEKVLH